jgi:hypothetical protein
MPIAIYPLFFILFTILNFFLLVNNRYLISKKLFNLLIFIFIFIFIATVSLLLNIEDSDIKQYFKIIINFIFLISSIYFINQNFYLFKEKRKIFQLLFEVIIVLTFIQVIINVYIINFWIMPFVGVENSVIAYRIVEPPIFFGTTEKNIWATKIAFIQIIYFSFIYFEFFKTNRVKLFFIWILAIFNILYTFSRTAQLVLLLFITMFFVWKIFYLYKNMLLKILATVLFLILSIPVGIILFEKLFHLSLGSGDGMAARLELWMALYNNLDNMNLFIGNGILYAKYVISHFTHWTNNNFHNVFLNTFADEGILGLITYILILRNIFKKKFLILIYRKYILLVLFLPFFACINSHYLGYDSDIVIYFSLVFLLSKYLQLLQGDTSATNFNHNPNI